MVSWALEATLAAVLFRRRSVMVSVVPTGMASDIAVDDDLLPLFRLLDVVRLVRSLVECCLIEINR